ncbi:hypothetical protein M9H77_09010 [Catharanthus roseus]|uniref:Uncharacterized protein n=1 Tax=Catharanthus roseus TaxID=4058 RepID=A0ACC0BZJ8_CATRO|nr:hypothetical protein M9H77_09010 [Catharanthus roseus]
MKYLISHLGPQLPCEFCGDGLGRGLDFIPNGEDRLGTNFNHRRLLKIEINFILKHGDGLGMRTKLGGNPQFSSLIKNWWKYYKGTCYPKPRGVAFRSLKNQTWAAPPPSQFKEIGPKKLQFMAITKDDTHHTDDYGDIPLHQEVNLRGTERIVVVTSNTMSDFPFILQHKIFIMSLFGIKAPSASANTPLQPQETIQAYIERFNKEAMKVPSLSDRKHIQAYNHGLRSLSITKVLATKRLLSVNELLNVVHEFIKGEINVQSTQDHLESRLGEIKENGRVRAQPESLSESRHIGASTTPELLRKTCMHDDRLNEQSPEP